MCDAFDKPEWLHDERFDTAHKRVVNVVERLEETQKVILTRTSEEWLKTLDEHGVPCAPILTRANLLDHPQIIENEIVETREHPDIGTIRQPRPAARFTEAPASGRDHAPGLGEHTREILKDLGHDEADIEALSKAGILG